MNGIWMGCVGIALACGFLGGIFVQQTYLAPPPVIYRTPPVRVEPASLRENCVEVARMCYARKRSAAIGDVR